MHKPRHTDAATLRELLWLQAGKCYICGCAMWGSRLRRIAPDHPDAAVWKQGAEFMRRSYDHVTPKSRGHGKTGNKLLAHQGCNNIKGDRAPHPCELIFLEAANLRIAHRRERHSGAVPQPKPSQCPVRELAQMSTA